MKQNLKLYVKHNISADKIAYLSSKKKYSAILKLKKREYTDKIQVILSNVKDPSQFWKTINSLKYRNNLQGEISTADWQVFYRELLGSNLTKVVQLPLEILDIDPELDCEISLTEVTKEISKLGKNKATGLDEIPNEAIKYLLEEHTIYLRNLFNKILGTSQVPQQWTKTIIHPIFKNGDPDNPSNYRGISLISNLSKLFTSILKTRLNDWMERKSILAENQAGFRKGYSCQDHIFTLVSLIQMTLSRRRGKLYAFFIDLRKAFDTVPHHLLWKKIALNGLSCRFIKLIKNYYTQMTATVRWRGSFTEAIKIQAGVLQGEPLSPYLFILFLNDLVHLFDESELPGINLENYGTIHLLLYADDIVILGESKINLQLKINLLKKYLEENCLTLNQNKSKIMVFRNGGRTARSETWFWGQQPLTIVAKYTYLGYPLTTKISTQYASQYFRNKALNAINALWRILTKARIKSFTSVMKLLDTIVLPTLLYAAPMWAINQLKTVNNTQDTFLRRLLDLLNFTPGYVLRRECGRISTELNAVKLTLKFWVRILKMETSRLPHACLNYLWKVTAKKEIENSFTQNLIKILDSKGYSFLKGCEDYLAIQKELPGIIRSTTDQLIQNDQMKITDSTHFAHYKFLSESFMTEEYLRLNISLPNKRLVAQHRVLWQFFREERKDFWKENGRNCLLCKDLMDDNLVHYFFQCPLLTEKRTETFPSPTSGQFRYHSICQLLSSDLNDKLLIDKYFKFCTEAGRMRKNAGQRILEDDPSREHRLFEVKPFCPCFDFVGHRNGGSTFIKFFVKNGFKDAKYFWMLQTAYGDAVMSRRRVFEWYKRFKEGREETADNERSGRPSTLTAPEKVDKALELVREDRRITFGEVAEEAGISFGSTQSIMKDILGVRRLNAVFVPKDLTFDQKNARKETASLNLEATTDDPELLKRIITGDETWIYGFDSETTQQASEWRFKMSRDQRKRGRLPAKSRRLREAIRQKRPELWRSNSWILHHDNAPAHTALKISKFLQDHSTSVLPQPPYSPDLAPCAFFLFGKLKKKLKGRKFQSIEEIKAESKKAMKAIPKQITRRVLPTGKKDLSRKKMMKTAGLLLAVMGVMTSSAPSPLRSLNQLAFLLQPQYGGQGPNTVYSPLAISASMAMIYGGARGSTARDIERVIGYVGDVHQDYKDIQDIEDMTLAYGIYIKIGYSVNPSFQNLIQKYYQTPVVQVDFENQEDAKREINADIRKQTQGKIPEYLEEELEPQTKLYSLSAAIYSGVLDHGTGQSISGEFLNPNTKPSLMEFQVLKGKMGYYYSQDYKAVRIPLKDISDLSVLIVVPESSQVNPDTLKQLITYQEYKKLWSQLYQTEVKVQIPEIRLDEYQQMSGVLQDIGLGALLEEGADLSGISSSGGLKVSQMGHRAQVEITGSQSERVQGSRGPSKEVKVNRPFVLYVVNSQTGDIHIVAQVAQL
ncbi:hypothetical protein LAZ67_21000621 [Cordylochernes scorpioides]|uniref:Reverse transcriptase domain-containing protein n=1 Tax=Cordylochernes scorpioides TaxID=51811 RepID=A0ABY6LLM8_9ARAC|nr:hypothetical protein LAZ67_21000621 [Cordylochernes scorpioides]